VTCQQCIEFLLEYLAGELAPVERAEFESHLRLCPPCLDYLRTYELAVRLGKAVCREPASPTAPAVPEELVQAILAARAKASPPT
jgi:anti-sigma factor RsiW